MKTNKKAKTKGCACYGVNSIHPCFCSPFNSVYKKLQVKKIIKNILLLILNFLINRFDDYKVNFNKHGF